MFIGRTSLYSLMAHNVFKGRGSRISPKNPYLKREEVIEHSEGIDEEKYLDNPVTKYFKESAASALSKNDSPDLPLTYSVNPYQGCEHGCIYCYARNSHQYWGFDAGLGFETNIVVKHTIADVLRKQFSKKGYVPEPFMLSGNTDCYQPAERRFGLTRKILKLCLEVGHPVSIITKNSLIQRDQDLLVKLAEKRLVHVYFSINHLDNDLKAILEPRTATGSKKLQLLRQFSQAGIPCGVMVAPIIPGLNTDDIAGIIEQAADGGALRAGYTVVRLNGTIKEIFKDWLYLNFPDRAQKVLHQIEELHGGQLNDSAWGRRMKGEGPLADMIKQVFNVSVARYMKDRSMPAFNLASFMPTGQTKLF